MHLHSHALHKSLALTLAEREKISDDRKESKGPTEFLEVMQGKRSISSPQYSFLTQFKNVPVNTAAPVLPLSTFTHSTPQSTANEKEEEKKKP